MTQWYRRPRLWLVLVSMILLVAAAALWQRGTQSGSDRSPLPTPVASGMSPLPTLTPGDAVSSPPSSWTDGGAVLLWVALGILLALGIAFIILRWYRGTA